MRALDILLDENISGCGLYHFATVQRKCVGGD